MRNNPIPFLQPTNTQTIVVKRTSYIQLNATRIKKYSKNISLRKGKNVDFNTKMKLPKKINLKKNHQILAAKKNLYTFASYFEP